MRPKILSIRSLLKEQIMRERRNWNNAGFPPIFVCESTFMPPIAPLAKENGRKRAPKIGIHNFYP
jgi:hypothetical protein